jgi:hypothetical protein
MKVEGRKAWVEGTIESLGTIHQDKDPTLYVEAKGLFIEPKYAAIMKVPRRLSLVVLTNAASHVKLISLALGSVQSVKSNAKSKLGNNRLFIEDNSSISL